MQLHLESPAPTLQRHGTPADQTAAVIAVPPPTRSEQETAGSSCTSTSDEAWTARGYVQRRETTELRAGTTAWA
jgi:hypothetical protein